jgi:hypothetical protein
MTRGNNRGGVGATERLDASRLYASPATGPTLPFWSCTNPMNADRSDF